MEDGFPPPIASRVYVYPHIAAFTVLHQFYGDSMKNLHVILRDWPAMPTYDTTLVNPELASLLTFTKVAKKVIFSEHYMVSERDSLIAKSSAAGLSKNVILASEKYADSVSQHLIKWIAKDHYIETRTMERFTSDKSPGKWIETPPDYTQALEPHWPKIRPLILDSAAIYQATPLPDFSTNKSSDFYKMAYQVYTSSQRIDSAKIETAWFWDDNPNTSDHTGHSTAIIHKISPPGHWLNIIHQISAKEQYSITKTSQLYTLTAIAMFDGIISCWHQKYETNLLRPITYIQENIDVNWKPLIQTPPFPEYTSGHSVLSAAAATILTAFVGKNYAFTDNTSEYFGYKARNFNSFDEAAWEVSLSRFYGGIHYMNGIEEGNKQGKFIGKIILDKIQ